MKKMGKSYAMSKNERYMSKGMKSSGKVMGHDGSVKSIPTNTEQYDMGKIRWDSVGTKGYPRQAFDYQY